VWNRMPVPVHRARCNVIWRCPDGEVGGGCPGATTRQCCGAGAALRACRDLHYQAVIAGACCGLTAELRRGLEERGQAYVVGVADQQAGFARLSIEHTQRHAAHRIRVWLTFSTVTRHPEREQHGTSGGVDRDSARLSRGGGKQHSQQLVVQFPSDGGNSLVAELTEQGGRQVVFDDCRVRRLFVEHNP
jgi:hypothetical protein